MLGVALAVALGVTAGLAVARPESLPGALRVTASSLPEDADLSAALTIEPVSVAEGGFAVRGHVTPSRSFDVGTLPPGIYRIDATSVAPDASVARLSCVSAERVQTTGQASALVRVIPGERVECAAQLHEHATLVLRHRSTPASDDPVAYDTTFDAGITLAHGDDTPPVRVPAGEHSLDPQLPRGWDVSRATCDNGRDPEALVVEPGESVTCTVRIEQRGRISLSLETEPADTQREFRLTPSWTDPLALAAGDGYRSDRLEPGSYRLRTATPGGWDVSSASCDDGSTLREISVDPGERVACTVTYTQRGRIIVANEPDAETSAEFDVDPSWGPPLTLTGEDSARSRLLRPGPHTVAVEPPELWALTDATCDDGSDPAEVDLGPGEIVTCTFASTQPQFTIASFNVLGNSHTAAGGRVPERPSGTQRMGWTVDLLRSLDVDVVGLQELQRPQMDAFLRLAGGEWDIYPPPGLDQQNKQNAIAWRSSVFTLVDARPVMTPYFRGKLVPMPLVRLRYVETGQDVYVMTVHNPASVKRVGDQSRWREAATRQQIDLTARLLADGIPVFMTGDMNERERYFCAYTASGEMHAAAGGSRGGACQPPPSSIARIDWIFASNDVEFSDYQFVRTPLVKRASDHPLVVAEASLR